MTPYETSFARVFGPDYYAFGFWKARVALYAILKSLDVRRQNEIILPGYTCVVVANSVRYADARPVYADISPKTFNLDLRRVEKRINNRTRAVIAQHTYGIPAEIDQLKTLGERKNLFVIEDCAHVLLGSTDRGRLLGSLGHAAFFSSQWSKPYTTGLGGMALTRDPELAQRLKQIQSDFQDPATRKKLQLQLQYGLFRRFFKPTLYWRSQAILNKLSRLGLCVGSSSTKELTGAKPSDFNWNMCTFQERTGLQQLSRIRENSAHRENLMKFYLATLRKHNWPIDDSFESERLPLLRLPITVKHKPFVLDAAKRARVEIGNWFESPLHPLQLSDHQAIDYFVGSCPVAESAARHVINLPLHHRVDHEAAEKIIRFVLSHASPAVVSAN